MIRSSLERLISISCAQRSSGIFAIVRSLVTPALWTTTSTPSASSAAIFSGASSAVMSSSIARPPIASVTAFRSAAIGGMSRPTTSAPSRARVLAIAAPIPREAPVTSATLPASGLSQSIFGLGGDALADPDHLTGDVGRFGGEEEAQRRLQLVLGAGLDVDELRGRAAAADLLGERAGEALQRPLGDVGLDRAGLRRRGAEDDDAAAALQAGDGGVEEALQLDQLGRVGDSGGVEDERLRLALGAGAFGLDAVEDGGDRLAEPAFRRGAGEDRAGDDWLALLVAVERDRLGQSRAAWRSCRRAAR